MKKIRAGTYKFCITKQYSSYENSGICFNLWNDLIIKNGLVGVELDVILTPKKRPKEKK